MSTWYLRYTAIVYLILGTLRLIITFILALNCERFVSKLFTQSGMFRGRCYLIGLTIIVKTIIVFSKPNLIVLLTDEHNLRTLGCYRDNMKKKEAFPWGKFNFQSRSYIW